MRFSSALDMMMSGFAVLRECWDPDECVYYVAGNLDMTKHTRNEVNGVETTFFDMGDEYTVTRMPEIKKCNKDGSVQIWTATNQDLLAMDWIEKKSESM